MSQTIKGLIFQTNEGEKCYDHFEEIINEDNTIKEEYKEVILSMENGKRFNGYVYEVDWTEFEIEPEFFDKVTIVLSQICACADLQYDEATEENYIVLNLTKEQENKLNELKNLCK